MDSVDDLGVVDASWIHQCDAEISVAKLSLNDVDRYTLPGHLNRVGVAELVRREPAPDAGSAGYCAEFLPGRCGGPGSAAGGAVDDAEQRARGELGSDLKPR